MATPNKTTTCYWMELYVYTNYSEFVSLVEYSDMVMSAMPACKGKPPNPTATAPNPLAVIRAFWYSIRLPVPKPSIAPGYAITGRLAYLTTGDTNRPAPWYHQTPFGLLRITATATYTVQWQAGTPATGPYTTPGAPYPTGTITHTYDDVGVVTVTVEEHWTATWSLAGISGTLPDLHTQATIPDFHIRQIQAVITH